ncbi:hypothetical protein Taro_014935 [Colocasia esculenta]|uniref:Uncharacterized protein n=1 Tax=Colocasia esculenta TaxID=4460 RepID=A0A843UKV4_COLES|nr:hypothetical protein [Colocasia esculenta]
MEHPVVCLPTDVAAAVCVTTSVEALPRSGVTCAVGGRDKGRCRDLVSHHDREAVATRCPITSRLLSWCPSPSRWHRDGLWGRDSACAASGGFRGQFVCRCDPCPQEPIEGVLRAMSVLELAAHVWDTEGFGVLSWRRPDSPLSHCLSLRWFRSHVVVSGVRPQLGQAAVLRVLYVLWRLCLALAWGRSVPVARACTVVIARLCLVSVGVVGLALGRPVLLVVPASVISRFRGPILGCQPVMALACVASRPGGVSGVWGVLSTAFALCPTPLVSAGVVFPAALAGEGLVIPTGPCSRGSPPYFFQLGARHCGSLVSNGLQRRLWLRVLSAAVRASVVSSCSLSELRAMFYKSSGYAP